MEKTRVMIVEDQELQRFMLEDILSASGRYEIVASIDNAELADLYVETKAVELILMDIYTAFGADGLEAAERIKEEYPATKIMIRTSMPESGWVMRAKACGVESFCYKDVGEAAVLDACDRTMRGESVYPEE